MKSFKITFFTLLCIVLLTCSIFAANASATQVTIIEQPVSMAYNNDSKLCFHVEQTGGIGFQWQISNHNNGSYTSLVDGLQENGMIVSGANTETLCIENCPVSYDNYYVKCIIRRSNFAGDYKETDHARMTYRQEYTVEINNVPLTNGKYKLSGNLIYAVPERSENYNFRVDGAVLTLNNFNLQSAFRPFNENFDTGVIFNSSGTLVVNGTNTIEAYVSESEFTTGIYCYGDLSIIGNGTLNIYSGNASYASVGIYADSISTRENINLFIKSGNVTTFDPESPGSAGIYSKANVTLSSGKLEINSGTSKAQSTGIIANNLSVISSELFVSSQKIGIKISDTFKFKSGKATLIGQYYALDLANPVDYDSNFTTIKYADDIPASYIKTWTRYNGSLNANFKYLIFEGTGSAEVSDITVSGIQTPSKGASISNDYYIDTEFDCADIDESYIKWYKSSENAVWGTNDVIAVQAGEVFEAGKYYYVMIYYKPSAPLYKISSLINIKLVSDKFMKINTYISPDQSYAMVTYRFNYPIPGEGSVVNNIYISGLYEPVVGNPLWYPVYEVMSDPEGCLGYDNCHWEYSSNNADWTSVASWVGVGMTFEKNMYYRYVCDFNLLTGYSYADDCDAYLNSMLMEKQEDGTWVYYYGHPKTQRNPVEPFTISGIDRYLKVGGSQNTSVDNILINNPELTVEHETWYEFEEHGQYGEFSGNFMTGKNYMRVLKVRINYPEYFDTLESFKENLIVNGNPCEYLEDHEYNPDIITPEYAFYWYMDEIDIYIYYPKVGTREVKFIDKISVITATSLDVGETLEFGVHVLEEGVDVLGRERWYITIDESNYTEVVPEIVNVIEENEIYKVYIEVKAKEDYYINPYVFAYVDGNLASVDVAEDMAYIEYSFSPTKNNHEHVYNVKNIDNEYLFSEATCKNKATYYYSCVCGKKGNTTFEYGDYAPHKFEEDYSFDSQNHFRICSVCGETTIYEPHIPNKEEAEIDSPVVCEVCGYIIRTYSGESGEATEYTRPVETTVATEEQTEPVDTFCNHIPSDSYSYNKDSHYKVCVICGEILEKENHTFNNGMCIICHAEENQTNKRSLLWLWIVLIVVFILALIFIIIVIVSKKNREEEEQAIEQSAYSDAQEQEVEDKETLEEGQMEPEVNEETVSMDEPKTNEETEKSVETENEPEPEPEPETEENKE